MKGKTKGEPKLRKANLGVGFLSEAGAETEVKVLEEVEVKKEAESEIKALAVKGAQGLKVGKRRDQNKIKGEPKLKTMNGRNRLHEMRRNPSHLLVPQKVI